jgi:PAS domain S-box-containing protein
MGDGWTEGVHPGDLEHCVEIYSTAFDRRERFSMDYRLHHRDGTYHWIQDNGTPRYNLHGEFVGYIGHCLDITERKRAENDLTRSEERFRSTLDNMMEACQIIGFDWRYIYLNDAADRQNRRPKEELLGYKVLDAWPGFETTDIFAMEKRCMEERSSHHGEFEFTFRDGSKGWFDVSMQPVPEGIFVLSFDITERKKSKEQLHETRNYLDNLLNYANAPIIVWDRNFRITQFNHAFELLSGRLAADVLGQSIDLLFPEDQRQELFDWIKTTSMRERWEVVEIPIAHRSGGTRTLIWNSANIYDASNEEIIATIAQGQDITERKLAEKRLKESEEKYRAIFENSSVAILLTNPADGKIISANSYACALFGRDEEEICQVGRTGLVDMSDPRLPELLEERSKTGRARGELTFLRKDGSNFQAEASSVIFVDSEGQQLTSMVIRDLTEQIDAENSLVLSEKKYKYLFENNPLPMWIFDLETLKFLEVNNSAIAHYGYSRAEFLNMDIKDIRPKEDIRDLMVKVQDKNIINHSGVWRHIKKNGNIIFVEVTTHIIDYEERPAKLVLANDVTERTRVEIEIQKLNTDLEEKVAKRTTELEVKNADLERMNKLFIGRELRMVELKNTIRDLEAKLNG